MAFCEVLGAELKGVGGRSGIFDRQSSFGNFQELLEFDRGGRAGKQSSDALLKFLPVAFIGCGLHYAPLSSSDQLESGEIFQPGDATFTEDFEMFFRNGFVAI